MDTKLCLYCEWFYIEMACPDLGEYTPGSDFHMICRKMVWEFDAYGTQDEYYKCMHAARTCDLYKENPKLIAIEAK